MVKSWFWSAWTAWRGEEKDVEVGGSRRGEVRKEDELQAGAMRGRRYCLAQKYF